MLIVQAKHLGMCFGVRDALDSMRALPNPHEVTVRGELVHNPVVIDELQSRGFHQQSEADRERLPSTPRVVITAHGASDREKSRLKSLGYSLHDTTCPLVRRAHKAALHYHNKGYFLVVIGKRGHVEVEGLVGDLSRFALVSSLDDVESYGADKIAVVNQTTTRPDEVTKFHRRIQALNLQKEVVLVDTTCAPTRDRQEAVHELVQRVQALVVVGGPNSNNTLALGQIAALKGIPWWRVSQADELRPEWFQGMRLVGLTAGTSTTDETVQEVYQALRRLAPQKLTA